MNAFTQPSADFTPGPAARFLHLADRRPGFWRRSARFRRLADGHPMEAYLVFMGRLAESQQALLDSYADIAVPLPDAELLARCRTHAMPPLPAQGWARDPSWREGLRHLLEAIQPAAPEPTQAAIRKLLAMDAAALEDLAARVLSGPDATLDPVAAPLVAAALQVYWTHLATQLSTEGFHSANPPGLCPVCGSAPVASVVRADGNEAGLRYLHCSLCESEWNLARAKCSNCDVEKGVVYVGIEGGSAAVKAEACDACHSYLKIFYTEKDTGVDPVADDLASLGLDLLMAEEGYARSGPNLLFVPGEEAATA